MSPIGWLAGMAAAAYVVGSIPFGLIVGLAKGVDIRQSGSRNIGATNAARVLGGKKWFFLVFVLDLLKGLLPVLSAVWLMRNEPRTPGLYAMVLLVAAAAVLGHMFSLFLGFKGGKGVATGTGVVLGIWPYFTLPLVGSLIVFGLVFARWKYISLGSVMAAATMPLFYLLLAYVPAIRFSDQPWPATGAQLPLLAFSFLISGLIIYRHRGNLARLAAGTEPKFQSKKQPE